MATSNRPRWLPPSERAAQVLEITEGSLAPHAKEVRLSYHGDEWAVNRAWRGEPLVVVSVRFSSWNKAPIARLEPEGPVRGLGFSILFPPDISLDEAKQIAEVYKELLNLVRVPLAAGTRPRAGSPNQHS